MAGVMLGGWLVYRTKRDSYDPLFTGQGKGEAFTIDDGLGLDMPVGKSDMPPETKKANKAFMEQFA